MRRIIILAIAALLVCLLLAGCTPKDAKPIESGTLPGITDPDLHPSPEGTVAPIPEGETTPEPEPVESGEDPTDPEIEQPDDPEEGGIEVVEDYTVEIGEGEIVGGD